MPKYITRLCILELAEDGSNRIIAEPDAWINRAVNSMARSPEYRP
jgi:hypothetical protein